MLSESSSLLMINEEEVEYIAPHVWVQKSNFYASIKFRNFENHLYIYISWMLTDHLSLKIESWIKINTIFTSSIKFYPFFTIKDISIEM